MTISGRVVRMPTSAELVRAEAVVRMNLDRTPLVVSDAADDARLKLECLQPTGSFKVRGALAALAALPDEAQAVGVVTASAGNHGLGVAYAASRMGIAATVVVPVTASSVKTAALRRYGVRVIEHGHGYADAERCALDLAEEGATYVSAYNDPAVIAGQASIAAELREQLEGPMTIVAPVGGGGLVAGLSLWAADQPDVHVIGVEAAASRAVSAAVAAGRVVDVEVAPTLADGLAGNIEQGCITPTIIARFADGIVSVSEPEIEDAIRFLAIRHGLVAEGSGAVAVAALLSGKVDTPGRSVAVVTGRNIALPALGRVLAAAE